MIKRQGRFYWLDIWVGKKRVRRSLKTGERSLAFVKAAEITRDLKGGTFGKPGARLSDFKDQYLAWVKSSKPGSYRTEIYQLAWIIEWMKSRGLETFGQITPFHVEQMRVCVRSKDRRTKEKKDKKGVLIPVRSASKATANRYCALLRTMFNRAADWGIYSGPNPVSKIKFYKENGKIEPASPENITAILKAAAVITADPQSPVQRVITDLIVLSVNTGLRKAEALNLKWRDVKDTEIEVHGKREKTRRVPLNATAKAAIERQPRGLGAYVFDVPNRSQDGVLRKTIDRIRKLSGVSHFHFHLCRHYFTSALLAAGVDIQTISELLGHSRFSTSLLYSHSTPERRRQAVDMIGIDMFHGQGTADAKSADASK